MEFIVYEDGPEIFDPLTKKSLGMLENPKGTFTPTHIQKNMTTLLSQARRPSKLLSFTLFAGEECSEFDLLKSIKLGDKVKVINRM